MCRSGNVTECRAVVDEELVTLRPGRHCLSRRGSAKVTRSDSPSARREARQGDVKRLQAGLSCPTRNPGRRVTAKERRSTTTAAPGPNKAHCHGVNVSGRTPRKPPHPRLNGGQNGNERSCAVERPTPIPTGTESARSAFVRLSTQERARSVTAAPPPKRAHCHVAKVISPSSWGQGRGPQEVPH